MSAIGLVKLSVAERERERYDGHDFVLRDLVYILYGCGVYRW